MSKFDIGAQPGSFIFKCLTMDGSPLAAGTVTKNAQGSIVFDASAGVQLPFKQNVEILRLVPIGANIEIYTVDADGADRLIQTITAAAPFVGSFVVSGSETIKFKAAGGGAGHFQMLARAFGRGQF
jgi:hypothetical protein